MDIPATPCFRFYQNQQQSGRTRLVECVAIVEVTPTHLILLQELSARESSNMYCSVLLVWIDSKKLIMFQGKLTNFCCRSCKDQQHNIITCMDLCVVGMESPSTRSCCSWGKHQQCVAILGRFSNVLLVLLGSKHRLITSMIQCVAGIGRPSTWISYFWGNRQ